METVENAQFEGGEAMGLTRRACLAGVAGALALPGITARAGSDGASQKLVIAAYPAVDKAIKAALPLFKAQHPGVEVQVISREFADHHTAMTTALTTASNLPSLMTLEVDYLGRFARGIGLEDLTQAPYLARQYRDRFVTYAFDQATDKNGAVLAIPTDIGTGTLLYRTDLLAKAGVHESDLTGSWEGYVNAGVRIKAATGAYLLPNARDIKDIVVRTGIQPGEGIFFDKDSKALIHTRRFQRAFELSLKVRQHKLDAQVRPWSSDWAEGFRRGAIASQMAGAWMAAHLNNWLAPNTRGLWRAAQLPEGAYAASGGTFYAIPRRSAPELKPLAWDFIRLMTLSREQQLGAFKTLDAFPALLETYEDPFFEQPIEFLAGQPARLLWRDAARRIRAVQVHKQDHFASEVVNTELDKVLDQGKPIDQALADAQRLIQARAFR
ncbi:extracellular solute-binding protein [Ideonella sp. DXS29W]|uniref:Extracellular solute-binding protein n=1 Tax=Ideonella lacteola TaxID=2984193 RepID=A0ABU9BVG1_9BURK